MPGGGVRRIDSFGLGGDGKYYALPLNTSGTAIQVAGSLTTSETENSAYEFAQVSLTGATTTQINISMTATRNIILKAHHNNSQTIFIGPSNVTATGFPLLPGESISFDFDDSNTSFFGFASSTSLLNHIALK